MFRYKQDIITALLVITTFLFFVFTPGKETLGSAVQGFIMALIFFGFLPLGYHFLVLKKKSESFALSQENTFAGWLLMIPVFFVTLVITLLCYRMLPFFKESILLPLAVENSFAWFVGYELLLVPVLVGLYEIFFRGFVQKSWLEKYWGGYALLAQSALFILFLLMTGSLDWIFLLLIFSSLASGFLVWKNNSLVQAWIVSWLYLLSFDIFVLLMR